MTLSMAPSISISLSHYLSTNIHEIISEGVGHILVVLLSMAIATALGVGIGIAGYRNMRIASPATALCGSFLTIPSFALLVLLIPILGFGYPPTVFSLSLYALLPIVRNTLTGLSGVDQSMVDAGRGMGLSRLRLLVQIELPLAWPVILAGIRTSTQMIIGIAAIAAYIQGPGLGNLIFTGLQRFGSINSVNQALAGTIGIVIVAILFDLAYQLLNRLTTPRGIRV